MTFDLLASITLTASAAVVVATLALALGENTRVRAHIAVALSAWFAVVATLAATGVLSPRGGLGTPGLGLVVLLPILLAGFVVLRSFAWSRRLLAMPVAWLVAVHVVRLIGVDFLILHGDGRLPATFATVAGWGDIVVGLTAAPVAWAAARKGFSARFVVLAWNIVGLLDLVAAITLGAISAPGPLQIITEQPDSSLMTTLPWLLIPGFLVPLLALTHLAIFQQLRRLRATCSAI